jgi:hypothetical protein
MGICSISLEPLTPRDVSNLQEQDRPVSLMRTCFRARKPTDDEGWLPSPSPRSTESTGCVGQWNTTCRQTSANRAARRAASSSVRSCVNAV